MADDNQPEDRYAGLRNALKSNHDIGVFEALGAALLTDNNHPNKITVDQFRPYVDMFKVDKTRYKLRSEEPNEYTLYINKLYDNWRHKLGINPYEVTYVVVSEMDDTIVTTLDRQFTRIASDKVAGHSARENLPAQASRGPVEHRENAMLGASITDLLNANSSPEQTEFFKRVRDESSLSAHIFHDSKSSVQRPGTATRSVSPTDDDDRPSNTVFLDDD